MKTSFVRNAWFRWMVESKVMVNDWMRYRNVQTNGNEKMDFFFGGCEMLNAPRLLLCFLCIYRMLRYSLRMHGDADAYTQWRNYKIHIHNTYNHIHIYSLCMHYRHIRMVNVMCTAAIKRLSFIFERFRAWIFFKSSIFPVFIDGSCLAGSRCSSGPGWVWVSTMCLGALAFTHSIICRV